MIKTILTLTAVAISVIGLSQSKFEIRQIGSTYSKEEIIHAFESADMCGSFFDSKRNKLTMDDGAILELKSAQEIRIAGAQIFQECVLPDNTIYYECIWSIAENGLLMKGSDTEKYKSPKDYIRENSMETNERKR